MSKAMDEYFELAGLNKKVRNITLSDLNKIVSVFVIMNNGTAKLVEEFFYSLPMARNKQE